MKSKITGLKKYLSLIKTIITSKQSRYSNILIDCQKNNVCISVYDGTVSYTLNLESLTEEEGKICVDGEKFCTILENWNKDEFIISTQKDKLILKLEKSNYTINSVSWENFPTIPNGQEANFIEIPSKVLEEVLYYSFCYEKASDIASPLTTVKLKIADGLLHAFSTDKVTFSFLKREATGDLQISIPSNTISHLKKFLSDKKNVAISAKAGVFYIKDSSSMLTILSNTLLYPDIEKVFIKDSLTHFSIDREEFISSLKRILSSADQKSGQVRFLINGSCLIISARTSGVEGSEEMHIETTGAYLADKEYNGIRLLSFAQFLEEDIILIRLDESKIELSDKNVLYLTTCLVKQNVKVGE